MEFIGNIIMTTVVFIKASKKVNNNKSINPLDNPNPVFFLITIALPQN